MTHKKPIFYKGLWFVFSDSFGMLFCNDLCKGLCFVRCVPFRRFLEAFLGQKMEEYS